MGSSEKELRGSHPASYGEFRVLVWPEPHPLLRIVRGGIRDWEKGKRG
jgi:hypothetical protein